MVHFQCFRVSFIWLKPSFEQILIEWVPQCSHRHMLCNTFSTQNVNSTQYIIQCSIHYRLTNIIHHGPQKCRVGPCVLVTKYFSRYQLNIPPYWGKWKLYAEKLQKLISIEYIYSTLWLVHKPYLKWWPDSQLICLKHGQSVKHNLVQNITDDKQSLVQEFVQEFNQFGCRLATVSLIFLHLGQYWHLATQDKLLWACILLGSSAACNRIMAPNSYYIFTISVLLQLPFQWYLFLVIYRIIYSRSFPCITCLHKKIWFK